MIPEKGQDRSCNVFCNLTSDVTHQPFCRILLVMRRTPLQRGEGTTCGREDQKARLSGAVLKAGYCSAGGGGGGRGGKVACVLKSVRIYV